jgi:5,5'-dehydrodivanillate O-demethylase
MNDASSPQRQEIDYRDFVHTDPGTLAGRYMRSFWQPICLAEEVETSHTWREKIMGQFVTLYRGESGAVHAVTDRCPHRGTQLSAGWVEGECIRCFYHGWMFSSDGACVEQPAENDSFQDKIRIASYTVREYLGLVFIYLGVGEPPEFPRYPELEDESAGTLIQGARAPVPCNYFQRIENAADQVHVAFAHRDMFGSAGVSGVPDYSVEETAYGILTRGKREGLQDRLTHFHMPNVNILKVPPGKGETAWASNVAWRVPVDDTHHRSFNVRRIRLKDGQSPPGGGTRSTSTRPVEIARAILDGEMRLNDLDPVADQGIIVPIQDNIAQMGQGPIADRENDHLGKSDVGVILIRKLWREELQALSDGTPLRHWRRPLDGLDLASGAETAGVDGQT